MGMERESSPTPSFLKPLVAMLSKPQLPPLALYVAGLIWIIKFRSIRQIAKQLDQRRTDRLHHLLSCAPLKAESLQQSVQGDLARQAADPSAAMVIDDTVDERKGKAIEGLGWHHSAHELVQGLCAVTAMLLSGSQRLLWGVRGYRTQKSCADKKDFRSKISLALDILAEAQRYFAHATLTVLMDTWYACAPILNFIKRAGWTFVTALRSNRIVYVQGRKRRLRHLAKGRRRQDFRTLKLSRGRRLRFTVLEVELPKVGPVQLVLSRIGKKRWYYLVTNDLEMAGRQIVRWYLQRSWIETLHREIKQHLGFGETFVRKWAAVQIHWTLVALAFNLVMLSAPGRRRRGLRGKLEAYQHSMGPKDLVHRFQQMANA
jgi:hypothetical protein